jgi:hypothetical protein
MATATKTRARPEAEAIGPESAFRPWGVTATEGARLLDRGVRALENLAAQGLIRVHELPGLPPRYCREDIERLAPPR